MVAALHSLMVMLAQPLASFAHVLVPKGGWAGAGARGAQCPATPRRQPLPEHQPGCALPRPRHSAADAFQRRAAALLQCWLLEGWFLPTLLLLPQEGCIAAAAPAASGRAFGRSRWSCGMAAVGDAYGRCIDGLAYHLADLLPPSSCRARRLQRHDSLPCSVLDLQSGLHLVARWWLLLVVSWASCCTAAQLFAPPAA